MMNPVKFTIFSTVILIIAVSSFGAAPAHLQWMNFYDSEPWTMDGWCNSHMSGDLILINEGAKRGLAGFVDVGHLFLRETWYGSGGTWSGFALVADYDQRWNAFKELITPAVTSGHVKGFMILDEPMWNGVSVAEMATITNLIKTTFPSCIIMVVEAAPVFTQGVDIFSQPLGLTTVPTGIDWIGFDYYTDAATVRIAYQTYMYPKMNANQRAILVPQAYGSNNDPGSTLAQYQANMIAAADAYYAWAAADTKVIGFVPWHWLTPDEMWWTGFYEVGTRDMSGLKAKWQQIGAEVRANNAVAAKTTDMPLVQRFDWYGVQAPQAKKSLPSTYTATPWGADTNAPSFNSVWISTAQKVSGTSSLRMAGSYATPAAWRYCWGTNSQNHARIWKGHPKQSFEFMIKVDNESQIAMDVVPFRSYSSPISVSFGSTGLVMADSSKTYNVAAWSLFNSGTWNKVKVALDMGSLTNKNDGTVKIWVNDVLRFNNKVTTRNDVVFDSIGFYMTSGGCYIDDMSISGEVGCGDWGYSDGDVNRDCKVDLDDFIQIANDWNNCTDPNDMRCSPL